MIYNVLIDSKRYDTSMNKRMEAKLWRQNNDKIICKVCPKACQIPDGQYGFCRTRYNESGVLYAENYGRVTAKALDPIEKKPLYHYFPGTKTLSISSYSCNFTCKHCQNHHLSQNQNLSSTYISPEELTLQAKNLDAKSISFTYNEPSIWFEYLLDVGKISHQNTIGTVMVTNGYLTEDAFRELAPYLDAIRIDLKAFTENFYKNICGAKLQPVLETILLAKEFGVHTELVTLIIPGYNDTEEEVSKMLSWEIENLGHATPHHFTKFSPMHHMKNISETQVDTMNRIFLQAENAGLYYPYLGNIFHEKGSSTFCPNCSNLLISRTGYSTKNIGMAGDRCQNCGKIVEGLFLSSH